MNKTHVVLKKTDVGKLPKGFLWYSQLQSICDAVEVQRLREGKEPSPNYIIVNLDEPFVGEVIEVLRKHGKWDEDNV